MLSSILGGESDVEEAVDIRDAKWPPSNGSGGDGGGGLGSLSCVSRLKLLSNTSIATIVSDPENLHRGVDN